jgi:hypothetical protein
MLWFDRFAGGFAFDGVSFYVCFLMVFLFMSPSLAAALQRWGVLVFFCSLVNDGGDLVFFLNWYTLYAVHCNDGAI